LRGEGRVGDDVGICEMGEAHWLHRQCKWCWRGECAAATPSIAI
jgi:hypothetical protein